MEKNEGLYPDYIYSVYIYTFIIYDIKYLTYFSEIHIKNNQYRYHCVCH